GATAALVVTWAANGIDMGGATATLFPSSAFLLAALCEARSRDPAEGKGPDRAVGSPSTQGLPWLWCAAGGLLVVAGLGRAQALNTLRQISATIAESTSDSPLDRTALDARAASAATGLPWDHRLPLLRSTLAQADPATAAEHMAHARALAPHIERLAHLQALLLSRLNVDDPRVVELLHEAKRLAPFGPDAWHLRMDMAAMAAHAGQAALAFDELLAAVRLSPAAVSRCRFDARRRVLRLDAGRAAGVDIPLDQLLDALEAEAKEIQGSDPSYATRLHLSLTQVLTLVGEDDLAEIQIERLFPDQPIYSLQQRTTAAVARGDFDTALQLHQASGPIVAFETSADRLLAQAFASEQDELAYAAALAISIDWLPDVLFEPENVSRMLRARQHWAERTGDTAAAQKLSHAIQWLNN
ncbi:MAG: hypothetical protein ACI9EF_002711, partial [Pseudohongiellaceae bacterium]